MDFLDGFLNIGPFRAVTWGIIVLFVGRWLIQRSSFLRDYNIAAVIHRYGPSHLAFIIVPLVCAFFIDIVNAFMIQYFLASL